MHTALVALTSYVANDIVDNSRKNPRNDVILRQEEGRETIFAPSYLLGRCSLLELQAVIGSWDSYVSRYERKLKNKMNDEIKLAGLEASVSEELEKHLILNSSRLRTFEDARREIVTYVEEKFGLRIRDSTPSDTGLREHSDVGAVSSLSLSSVEG